MKLASRFFSLIWLPAIALLMGASAVADPREETPSRYDLETDVPARNTIIELNTTAEGANYKVQVRPYDKFWAHEYNFDVTNNDPKLRIRLTPGKYKLRTRTFDKDGFYGAWSDWLDFWIHYQPPPKMYPEDGASIKPKSGIRERIAFEWPEVPGVSGYFYVLRDKKGKILKTQKTQNTWVFEELDLAADYSWTVLPLDAKQFKEDQPDPKLLKNMNYNSFRVQGPAPGTRDAKVYAKPVPRAVKYQFEFLKLDRLGERGSASIYENPSNEFSLALAPGMYEVRVRTYFDDQSVSDWSPPWPFFVPYQKVVTKAPKNNKEFDPRDDEASPVHLKWEPQADVNHYVIYLYNDRGEFIRFFKSEEPDIKVALPHLQTYRWLVIPYSAGQSEIRPPEMPADAPRFSIGKYIPILLGSTEEPRHVYAWGRYWTSYINYEGRNYDGNSLVRQPIYGGTGELALGYWHRKTGLGLLGHGALSGFQIGSNVYNYANGGLHLGYRYVSDGGTRIRVWLGVSYMEFPEFLRDPFVRNMDYRRIKNAGPQLQVSYMDDFTSMPKYGWHTYAILYRGDRDLGTPNDLPQVPRLSYTFGLFGTYRYSDRAKWMLGYSYRVEHVQYKSTDRNGIDNSSMTSGHFLNLSIEYGLSEYYK